VRFFLLLPAFEHLTSQSPWLKLVLKFDFVPPDDHFVLMLSIGIRFGYPVSGNDVEQAKYAGAAKVLMVVWMRFLNAGWKAGSLLISVPMSSSSIVEDAEEKWENDKDCPDGKVAGKDLHLVPSFIFDRLHFPLLIKTKYNK
jgi:hypothetical protein